MTLSDAQKLYADVQRSLADVGTEMDLNSATLLNKKMTDLLVEDFPFSLTKNIEVKLWRIYRAMIDSVSSNKDTSKSVDNAVNMVICWLTQLSLKLHIQYRLLPHDLPPVLTVNSPICGSRQKEVEEEDRLKILAFIALRMGDLHRYKNDLDLSEKFYRIALGIQPSRGDVWNQLGVLAKLRGSLIDAVYYHTRALHSPTSFQGASTNIAAILKKFANKDEVSSLAPRQELFLTVLGKLYFMLPISEELIDRLGSKLIDVKTITPLLAIYNTYEEKSDAEKVSKRVIEQLLKLTFLAIVERFESAAGVDGSLLSCLSLLLRLPAVWQPNEAIAQRLEVSEAVFNEEEYLHFFKCLEDPFNYPIQWSQMHQLLAPKEKKDEDPKKKEGGAERERRRRRTVLVAPLPH